jgi:large subunit ribosomal protein L10
MLKQDKQKVVAELTERLRATETLIVADYRGLTMSEIDELRTKLLETGARFSVVKNTLTRIAAEAAGSKEILDLVEGPTAIAFLDADGDPVAAAKVLSETARRHDVLVIKGGVLDGAVVSDAEVKSLATLPPTDVLQAQLVSAVTGPLMTIVGLFTAPVRDLVNIVDARIKQLEEQGESVPEPATEEPAAEAASEEPAAEAEDQTAEEPTAEASIEEPAAEAEREPAETEPDQPSAEEESAEPEAAAAEESEEETSGES